MCADGGDKATNQCQNASTKWEKKVSIQISTHLLDFLILIIRYYFQADLSRVRFPVIR